jgi:hypothetical protein
MAHINIAGRYLTKAEFNILYSLYKLSGQNNPDTEAQNIHDFRGYTAKQLAESLGYQYPYVVTQKNRLISQNLIKVIHFLSKDYLFCTVDAVLYFDNLERGRISAVDILEREGEQNGTNGKGLEAQR